MMSDSFMHKHQASLDSQREEAEINWLFPEDRFIKLSLEHISFIVIFLLAIQKDYPKAKFAIKKADLVIDLILDQFKEMKNLDVIKIIKNHYGQEWIEANTND